MEEGTFSKQRWTKATTPVAVNCIAGPQRAMPKLLQMSLEANERVVGTSAVFLGVVPDASKLLLAVDGQNHRIEIEGEGSPPSGQWKELSAQLIVQADKLTDRVGTDSFEESAQGRRVGEPREAPQGQEGAVVRQNLGLVDASQARHDGVQESQNQIAGKIVGVSLRHLERMLKPPAQPELVAKTLQQHHATEVGEMRLGKLQTQCS